MSFQETTGSLFSIGGDIKPQPDQETFYYINFTKLENVNDLILILASMGFGLSDKNPNFESVKKFLDLDKPVRLK